jgi:hypothetical protein
VRSPPDSKLLEICSLQRPESFYGFSSLDNFENQAKDGYFYDKISENIWVRKNAVVMVQ